MKYFNLTYLIHSLSFNDKITLKSGASYSVEQIHDRFWLDLYDNDSNLKTFDLKRLFINEKILSINNAILPSFDMKVLKQYGYETINSIDIGSIWIPISFIDLVNFIKDENIYAELFNLKANGKIYDEFNWSLSHFIKINDHPISDDYLNLKKEYQDEIALIKINKDFINDLDFIKKNNFYVFKNIPIIYIEKVYFENQLAMDKLLGMIRSFEYHDFIKSKCIYDPYLLDSSLIGKW